MTDRNKVVVITGAGRGIGLACAQRFAQSGYKVVIADIDDKAGELAIDGIKAKGGEAAFIHTDVGDRLDIRNLVAASVDQFGRIDVLINNAALPHAEDFFDIEEGEFEQVMKVNLRGPFLASQAAARQMVQQQEHVDPPGEPANYTIINISSVSAVVVVPSQILYAVSKGGLNQLTKGMALALAPHGIRVNAIGPGTVETDTNSELVTDERARSAALARTPMGRLGKPEEVASVAFFLASKDAGYITGQCFYVDGGRLVLNDKVPD